MNSNYRFIKGVQANEGAFPNIQKILLSICICLCDTILIESNKITSNNTKEYKMLPSGIFMVTNVLIVAFIKYSII